MVVVLTACVLVGGCADKSANDSGIEEGTSSADESGTEDGSTPCSDFAGDGDGDGDENEFPWPCQPGDSWGEFSITLTACDKERMLDFDVCGAYGNSLVEIHPENDEDEARFEFWLSRDRDTIWIAFPLSETGDIPLPGTQFVVFSYSHPDEPWNGGYSSNAIGYGTLHLDTVGAEPGGTVEGWVDVAIDTNDGKSAVIDGSFVVYVPYVFENHTFRFAHRVVSQLPVPPRFAFR